MRFQEIFDVCAGHLVSQKTQCMDSYTGSCMYFGENGLRCGASPLLRDELVENIEFRNTCNRQKLIDEVPNEYFKEQFQDLSIEEIDLAISIQNIHDAECIEDWQQELENLGKRYKLSLKVLEK